VITKAQWDEFAEATRRHIEEYTIPQYGEWPKDPLTGFSAGDILTSIARYQNRRGKSSRGIGDEALDCLKIAHYIQTLTTGHGPRVAMWERYAKGIGEHIETYGADSLVGYSVQLVEACEHWHKIKDGLPTPAPVSPEPKEKPFFERDFEPDEEREEAVEPEPNAHELIPVPLLRETEGVSVPEYKSAGASGFDLAASRDIILWPWRRKAIPTGWRMSIPDGHEVQIRPRSGLALKGVFLMPNAPGTIDADYRGEVKIILLNASLLPVRIRKGDRIAQGVLTPVKRAIFSVSGELGRTARGDGGFGSTGV